MATGPLQTGLPKARKHERGERSAEAVIVDTEDEMPFMVCWHENKQKQRNRRLRTLDDARLEKQMRREKCEVWVKVKI